MPIAAAAIGAVGAIGGSLIGAGATKSAAKKAAKAQAEATAANNAMAREFRAENTANLSPFMERGDVAGAYINALLGLPGAEYTTQVPGRQPQRAAPNAPNLGFGNFASDFPGYYAYLNPPAGSPNPMNTVTTQVQPVNARKAFNAFKNSTGYKFRVNQGMDALNQGYAAKGALRSGAAMKDFMQFGQGIASDEFGRYLGYLGGQQGTGLSGASAIAGVSQNAMNAMTQNNNNAADAASNAALMRGTATQNMWGNVGNALGNLAQSSFNGGMNQNNINRISGDVQNTLNTNSSIF